MAFASSALYLSLALLIIDNVIEMGFIVGMVAWLHKRAGGDFIINNPAGGQFPLHGKPEGFLVDQGHASNGAAGTAWIVVGLGGIIALTLRNRQVKRTGSNHGIVRFLYNFWLIISILSAVYTVAVLVYTFVLTYRHDGQSIKIDVAAGLDNKPFPNQVAYPRDEWTPQNWYPAVLRLPLADQDDRDDISFHLKLMKGWQWNLIPMAIISLLVMVLALADKMAHRQRENRAYGERRLARNKQESVPLSP